MRPRTLAIRAPYFIRHARPRAGHPRLRCHQVPPDVDGRDKPGHDGQRKRHPIMATHKLLLLPGDGIGPEVMAEVKKVIGWMNAHQMGTFETEEGLVGGSCYDAHGVAVTDETVAKAQAADAVIFGAVGGPKWDKVPYDMRPEAGLLRLRKDMALFANIRPAICYPQLAASSSLTPEGVDGLDIIIL